MFSFCWVVCQEVPWWPLGPSDESPGCVESERSGTDWAWCDCEESFDPSELSVSKRQALTQPAGLVGKSRVWPMRK